MIFERDINCDSPYFSNISKVTYVEDTDIQNFTYLGFSYIIFVHGRTDYFDNNGMKADVPKAFIKGAGDYFSTKGYKGAGSIAFELPAQAMYIATGRPATELKNINLDLSELIPKEIIDKLYDEIISANSFQEMKTIFSIG